MMNYQTMIERNRMRVNGELITHIENKYGRLTVVTSTRVYNGIEKQGLRSKMAGGWLRLLGRVYGRNS